MAVQVQQAAIVAEGEGITTHGCGLELIVAHEDDDSHTTLQTHRAGSIAILAVQAGFAGVAERAAGNLAILILNIINHRTTTHYQGSLIITAAGNGHGTFAHLADFLAGASRELQSQAGTLLNFKTGAGEGVISSLGQLPVTLRKGERTSTHIHITLQLNHLLLFGICSKGKPLGISHGIGRALAGVVDDVLTLRQGAFTRCGIRSTPGNGISAGESGIDGVLIHGGLSKCGIEAGVHIIAKALDQVRCPQGTDKHETLLVFVPCKERTTAVTRKYTGIQGGGLVITENTIKIPVSISLLLIGIHVDNATNGIIAGCNG